MNNKPLPIVHDRRELAAGDMLRVEQVELEFPNGERRTYSRMKARGLGAVIIVPMLDATTVLLAREYAAGLHHYEIGLPKGRLERGESILEAAQREMKEEIGYGARNLQELTRLSLAPAYMTHMTHIVLARDLYPEILDRVGLRLVERSTRHVNRRTGRRAGEFFEDVLVCRAADGSARPGRTRRSRGLEGPAPAVGG